MKVGFIGLGRMGQGMAGRILQAGHDLVLYDAWPQQMLELERQGARVAASISELTGEREVIISMLPSDAVLQAVVNDAEGLRDSMPTGMIHMSMGTHGVAQIRSVNDTHTQAGQTFIAAPVLGRPDLAAQGLLSIVPAGPPQAVEKMHPLFDVLGKQFFNAGTHPQTSTAVKVANNFLLGTAIESMGEAFSLVRKLGVEPALFQEVMMKGLFGAPAYEIYGSMIAGEAWDSIGATATIGLKDADLVVATAEAAGVPMPCVHIWREHLQAAIDHGEAQLDWAVMARQQFRNSGLENAKDDDQPDLD
jgi:3-hydroxyisobutyrate dehydrogenase-like beta-hydroxyacid dehydrogenase